MIDADDVIRMLNAYAREDDWGIPAIYTDIATELIEKLADGFDTDAMLASNNEFFSHDCGKGEYCPQFGKEFLRSYREHSDLPIPEWGPLGDSLDPNDPESVAFGSTYEYDWDDYMGDLVEIGGEG